MTSLPPHTHILQPDPALRALLLSLPLPKVVFTNADRVHAERCMSILGIQVG